MALGSIFPPLLIHLSHEHLLSNFSMQDTILFTSNKNIKLILSKILKVFVIKTFGYKTLEVQTVCYFWSSMQKKILLDASRHLRWNIHHRTLVLSLSDLLVLEGGSTFTLALYFTVEITISAEMALLAKLFHSLFLRGGVEAHRIAELGSKITAQLLFPPQLFIFWTCCL